MNYLEKKKHTKAEYRKISKISRVAGNVGTPLAAVCVGAVMNWLATSVKETRATRVERVSMSSVLSFSHCWFTLVGRGKMTVSYSYEATRE